MINTVLRPLLIMFLHYYSRYEKLAVRSMNTAIKA